jgi:hypothetical protein
MLICEAEIVPTPFNVKWNCMAPVLLPSQKFARQHAGRPITNYKEKGGVVSTGMMFIRSFIKIHQIVQTLLKEEGQTRIIRTFKYNKSICPRAP